MINEGNVRCGTDGLLLLLRGAWRQQLPPFEISPEDLDRLAPHLLAGETGGLIWRRIASTDLCHLPSLSELSERYKEQARQAVVHEIQLSDVLTRIRSAGVEPILFKGWGLARLYPEAGLRPYGDIDLWMPADDIERVHSAFRSNGYPPYCVELHSFFYRQYERSLNEVSDKSQLVDLPDSDVRIPCPEDQLRFICLHFLFHGGWRPLWLCDVALMVESAGSGFDWDRCLRGNQKHADWVACVIGLAHQLLGADVASTPVAKRAKSLPRWLKNAVLAQWEKGPGMSFAENLSFSTPRGLLKPAELARSFREHWRNPIQASVEMNAWFNESPRAFLQFGSVFLRIPEFVKYFGREIQRT